MLKIKSILLINILLITTICYSQWTPNTAVNTTVCDTTNDQVLVKISPTTDGVSYISWFDGRAGGYAVYLQKLDAQGNKQFASGGLLISNNSQNSSLVDYDMKTDANNNAIIAFTDIRNSGTVNPFAYCINPAGTFLWGPNGITLSTSNTTFQPNPKIAVTYDGYFVIAWIFGSSPNKIALQKINSTGNKQWGNDPIYLSGGGTENFTYPDLVPTNGGGIIMLWSGYSGTFLNPQNYRLYTQKFSSNGLPLWNSTMDTVYGTNYVSGYYVPRIFPAGNFGAIFCWRDFRGNANYQTGYIQRIDSSGNFKFPANGSAVSTLVGNNHFDPVAADMPSYGGETVAFWYESNNLQSSYGVSGQNFSYNGTQLWGSSGIAFQPLWANQPSNISIYVKDTFAICYYNESSGANNIIKAFKVGKSGGMVWSGNIIVASSISSPKIRLNVTQNSAGMSMLAWQDNRNDAGGIYAQNINFDGSFGILTGIQPISGKVPDKFSLLQNYPNPFNPSTNIKYQIPKNSYVTLKVFDVLGREVMTLVSEKQNAGSYEVSFDGSNFSSGVYFYKLTAENYDEVKKMLLVK